MSSLTWLPEGCIIAYVAIMGLCIGSFLNVVIFRGLKGESIAFPASKCPKCGQKLKWYMNIPVLSYIFLGAKCAYCKEPIDSQYPIIETLNGLFYILAYFAFGLSLKFLFVCIIMSLFLVMVTTDIRENVVIDYHTYILAVVGFVSSFFNLFYADWLNSIIGAVVGFIVFELLSRSGQLICSQRMFGFGDSLVVLALGTMFGPLGLAITILLGAIIQVVCAIPMLAKNAYKERKEALAVSYVLIFIAIFLVIFSGGVQGDERLIYSIVISIILLTSLKNIIIDIKKKKEKLAQINDEEEKFEKSPFYLLPFVPALLIAATINLFYLNEIKMAVHDFFF